MNKKIFAIVVITLLISVAGYLAFMKKSKSVVHQSTPVSESIKGGIASWKIYHNEKYGFEFKYPSEWETPKTQQGSGDSSLAFDLSVHLGCPKINMGGEGQCPLQVIVVSASSPEEFLSKNFSPDTSLNESRSDISYKQINNIQTAHFTNFSDYSGNFKYITFFGADAYVTFSDYLLSYENNDVYNQILSTFKFTK